MTALNFPDSPTTGQTYTVEGKSWIYSGTRWEVAAAAALPIIRTETADTDLVSNDQLNVIRFNGTSAQVLTVENALDVGGYVTVIQDNSGSVEFQSGAGVTLLSSTGLFTVKGQNSVVTIRCVASGQYRLSGELTEPIPFAATGGTVSTSGDYTIHTFTSSGTFEVTSGSGDVDYLIVAGGGGGGNTMGGGGGAGGRLAGSSNLSTGTYSITVGSGGSGAANRGVTGGSGTNSTFNSLAAVGGGGGSSWDGPSAASGGSGGGGNNGKSAATGTSGQGNSGGGSASNGTGGGGGGAGAVGFGGSALEATYPGRGGVGVASSISGTSTYYAGGGGGGGGASGGYPAADRQGGAGGGGNGGNSANGSNGTANTGGGGGGGGYGPGDFSGGSGGTGIVIVRYLTNA